MLHPATPIYEVVIGSILLSILFGTVFSIPMLFALYQDAKEQKLRSNSITTETKDD